MFHEPEKASFHPGDFVTLINRLGEPCADGRVCTPYADGTCAVQIYGLDVRRWPCDRIRPLRPHQAPEPTQHQAVTEWDLNVRTER